MTSNPRWTTMLALLMGVSLSASGCAAERGASPASSSAVTPSAGSSVSLSPSAGAGQTEISNFGSPSLRISPIVL
ncbi:unannotated protein [freshwater metagenome]|uniref:Unannotated protein n=1 Tax=freshwater metagenome TaxID=449393 RepID=A0A6J7SKP5_9ZZZZ